MDSLIERIYLSERSGEALGNGLVSPDDAESDFFFQKLYDEICRYCPDDAKTHNNFHTLICLAVDARGEQEYRRGVKFAVRFMCEAMQSPAKTVQDFNRLYETIME